MVVYPLSWPAYAKIASSGFGLHFHQGQFGAEFSGKLGVKEFNAGRSDRWEGFYTMTPLSLAQGAKFRAFLASLRGGQGTFYAFDPDRQKPSTFNGSFPGSGLVDGAGQTGRTLNTDGWAVSSLILKTGDLAQIGNQLLEVSTDVTSDGLGKAILAFQPALRAAPPDGATIITSNPVMKARLKPGEYLVQTEPTHTAETTIFFEEVIE